MEKNSVEELIAKYNEGLADPMEIKLIEQLLEDGLVALTQLRELHLLDEQLTRTEAPAPSLELDAKFYAMLSEEKRKLQKAAIPFRMPDWNVLFPRLAMAASTKRRGMTRVKEQIGRAHV